MEREATEMATTTYYSGPPPPGYVAYGPPAQAATVIVTQPAPPRRPADYMGLAIFVCLCCGPLFGLIAIILSAMSSSAADDGDYKSARTRGKVSLACSLLGMIVTVGAGVGVLVWWFVFATSVLDSVS